MTPPDLTRRLAARKLAAARLATDLILDCERAASRRNGKRADPARWTETDWSWLSPRRGSIARDLKASAALSHDRRHRGRALRPLTPVPTRRRFRPRRAHLQFVIKRGLDMNLALRKPMTLAEFLEWEEQQPLRYEFDGVGPVAMAGGSVQTRSESNAISLSLLPPVSAVNRANSLAAISKSRPKRTTPATPTALLFARR